MVAGYMNVELQRKAQVKIRMTCRYLKVTVLPAGGLRRHWLDLDH
jgi:hypothetical protein